MDDAAPEILSLRLISTEQVRVCRIGEELRQRLECFFGFGSLPPITDPTDMNKRLGHTESFNRVLVRWLELQKAMAAVKRPSGDTVNSPLTPWDCSEPEIRRLWQDITRPENLPALWEWLYQSASGEQEIWAQQALQECLHRTEGGRP